MSSQTRLTRRSLPGAVAKLATRDQDLAQILTKDGLPPLWERPPGFATLVRIILEQQVSLASAQAVYVRMRRGVGRVTPLRVLVAGEHRLRRLGLTRQKARYCVNLARAVADGELDLGGLSARDDEEVRTLLTRITGIGRWTADVYLLMALGRPDIWPHGDMALAKATVAVKRLPAVPDSDRLARLAQKWSPLCSVAARMLWHHYLKSEPRARKRRLRGVRSSV